MNTTIEPTARDGQPAFKLTCDCKTHEGWGNGAILVGAAGPAIAKLKGKALTQRIHGFVTMANHPSRMVRTMNERDGIFTA